MKNKTKHYIKSNGSNLVQCSTVFLITFCNCEELSVNIHTLPRMLYFALTHAGLEHLANVVVKKYFINFPLPVPNSSEECLAAWTIQLFSWTFFVTPTLCPLTSDLLIWNNKGTHPTAKRLAMYPEYHCPAQVYVPVACYTRIIKDRFLPIT